MFFSNNFYLWTRSSCTTKIDRFVSLGICFCNADRDVDDVDDELQLGAHNDLERMSARQVSNQVGSLFLGCAFFGDTKVFFGMEKTKSLLLGPKRILGFKSFFGIIAIGY